MPKASDEEARRALSGSPATGSGSVGCAVGFVETGRVATEFGTGLRMYLDLSLT